MVVGIFAGNAVLGAGRIHVVLPQGADVPDVLPEIACIFYMESTGGPVALLVVGEGLFLRFDHLLG